MRAHHADVFHAHSLATRTEFPRSRRATQRRRRRARAKDSGPARILRCIGSRIRFPSECSPSVLRTSCPRRSRISHDTFTRVFIRLARALYRRASNKQLAHGSSFIARDREMGRDEAGDEQHRRSSSAASQMQLGRATPSPPTLPRWREFFLPSKPKAEPCPRYHVLQRPIRARPTYEPRRHRRP